MFYGHVTKPQHIYSLSIHEIILILLSFSLQLWSQQKHEKLKFIQVRNDETNMWKTKNENIKQHILS